MHMFQAFKHIKAFSVKKNNVFQTQYVFRQFPPEYQWYDYQKIVFEKQTKCKIIGAGFFCFFYSSLVLVSNTMRNFHLSIFFLKNQDCFICFFYFSNLRKTYFVNRF